MKKLILLITLSFNPLFGMEPNKPTLQERKFLEALDDALIRNQPLEPVEKILREHPLNLNQLLSASLGSQVSPLVATIIARNRAAFELLLAHGADPNFCGYINRAEKSYDFSPLYVAIDWDWMEGIEILLRHGANANFVNNGKFVALWRALQMEKSNIDLIKLLLAHQANPNWTLDDVPLLFLAIEKGNAQAVELLLKAGAELTNCQGYTPITYACFKGNQQIVEALAYCSSIDLDASDPSGSTPFGQALNQDNHELLRLLLNLGCRPHSINGCTPLTATIEMGKRNCCVELLRHNEDVNQKDEFGNTPLILACLKQDSFILEKILDYQPDIQQKDAAGRSSLRLAALNSEIFAQLVARFGNQKSALLTCDDDRVTALLVACVFEQVDVVRYLLEHGCNPNARSQWGTTPLIAICSNAFLKRLQRYEEVQHGQVITQESSLKKQCEIAQLLLDYGAHIDAQDNDKNTALMALTGAPGLELQRFITKVETETGKKINLAELSHDIDLAPLVQILLARGANIDLQNKNGFEARQLALQREKCALIELIDAPSCWGGARLKLHAARAYLKSLRGKSAVEIKKSFATLPLELRTCIELIAPIEIKRKMQFNQFLHDHAFDLQKCSVASLGVLQALKLDQKSLEKEHCLELLRRLRALANLHILSSD